MRRPPAAVPPSRRTGAWRRWLANDTRRSLVACLPFGVAAALEPRMVLATSPDEMIVALPTWCAWIVVVSLLYVLLTFSAFRGESGDRLMALMRESEGHRTGWRRFRDLGDGPVAWSLVLSSASLLSGTVAARASGSGDAALLGLLAVLLVTGAWATTVAAYAVQYARIDALHGGLEFPGDEERTLTDYVYLSVTVATAFTTSDVMVTTRRLRRTMIGNSIISFTFGTVVLATVITVF